MNSQLWISHSISSQLWISLDYTSSITSHNPFKREKTAVKLLTAANHLCRVYFYPGSKLSFKELPAKGPRFTFTTRLWHLQCLLFPLFSHGSKIENCSTSVSCLFKLPALLFSGYTWWCLSWGCYKSPPLLHTRVKSEGNAYCILPPPPPHCLSSV